MRESKEIDTLEQKSREARAMTQAETARRRRLRRDARMAGEKPPKFDKSPRQITADRLGMSEATVQRACLAVKALDAADESGNTERANAIREAFGTSINTAARAAAPSTPEPVECSVSFTMDRSDEVKLAKALSEHVAAIGPMVDKLETAHGGPSHFSGTIRRSMVKAEESSQEWLKFFEKRKG